MNSPYINHFLSPDSIIPEQTNPQSWDRYAYVQNNPLRYTDPTGHDPIPGYFEFIQGAVAFFQNLGYEVIGNPIGKSIHANGADLVFKAKEGAEVLAVELKDTASVTLGTLGKNKLEQYGGSIEQTVRSASRFINSSNKQLQQESEAILGAAQNGSLKNALYTTAGNVSQKAKDVFNNVYQNMPKALPPVTLPNVPLLDFPVGPKCYLDGSCRPSIVSPKKIMQ